MQSSHTNLSGNLRKEWILKKETELRCEVKENEWLTVRLTNGLAELFGVELAQNKDYTFRDQNFAIYAWYGCTLETVSAESTSIYVADSTPMVAYVNTHIQLEARRDAALANADYGPRVIIVGGPDQGKSSFAQILTAYALRLDRSPIYIDLDVGQSSFINIPGNISAVPLDKNCLNVEEGFINYNPLVYFYGHTSPKDNTELYKLMVSILAKQVNQRLAKDSDARSSGVIVNTNGWIEGQGYEIILHIIKELSIDVILVMNNDKLYSNLFSAFDNQASHTSSTSSQQSLTGKPIVVKLPSSGGIVQRDAAMRKRIRKTKIKEYFYGRLLMGNPTTNQFSPERKDGLSISAFTFLRIGGIQLSEGMKVIDKSSSSHQDNCKIMKFSPTSDLVYSIVAVLHNVDQSSSSVSADIYNNAYTGRSSGIEIGGEIPQDLIENNISGFVSIVSMDFENDRMTLLSPCPGALPSTYLLVGSVKYLE